MAIDWVEIISLAACTAVGAATVSVATGMSGVVSTACNKCCVFVSVGVNGGWLDDGPDTVDGVMLVFVMMVNVTVVIEVCVDVSVLIEAS